MTELKALKSVSKFIYLAPSWRIHYDRPCCSAKERCSNNGTCSEGDIGSYNCACSDLYSGDTCQYDNPCIGVTCAANRACVASGANYTCSCTGSDYSTLLSDLTLTCEPDSLAFDVGSCLAELGLSLQAYYNDQVCNLSSTISSETLSYNISSSENWYVKFPVTFTYEYSASMSRRQVRQRHYMWSTPWMEASLMLPRSSFSHVQNFTGTTLFFLGISKLEHIFVINSEHLVPVLVHILSNYNF